MEQFKVYIEGVRRHDEDIYRVHSPMPRLVVKIFHCIQALNPDQDGISRDEYKEFYDKIYWPTFLAEFGSLDPYRT